MQNVAQQPSETFSSAIAEARNYMEWIVSALHPFIGRSVLEVGVGHGSYYEYLAKGRTYLGCDLDDQNVARSRSRFPDGKFEVADITSDDFVAKYKSAALDTVVCFNVVEHIYDDAVAITNMASVLRRAGHLLLLVPAHRCLYNDLDRLAGHYRRYDKRLLLGACVGAPIEVVDVRYFNPIGGVAWWANKLVRHRSLDDASVNAQIKLFDRFVLPISRAVNPLTSRYFGQSLILVGRRR